MKMTNTWVLNKRTGKYESKSDSYKPPVKKIKPKLHKKKRYKPDKKTAAAYHGSKQLDLEVLKKSRNVN